jgi:hypothetical protein
LRRRGFGEFADPMYLRSLTASGTSGSRPDAGVHPGATERPEPPVQSPDLDGVARRAAPATEENMGEQHYKKKIKDWMNSLLVWAVWYSNGKELQQEMQNAAGLKDVEITFWITRKNDDDNSDFDLRARPIMKRRNSDLISSFPRKRESSDQSSVVCPGPPLSRGRRISC